MKTIFLLDFSPETKTHSDYIFTWLNKGKKEEYYDTKKEI